MENFIIKNFSNEEGEERVISKSQLTSLRSATMIARHEPTNDYDLIDKGYLEGELKSFKERLGSTFRTNDFNRTSVSCDDASLGFDYSYTFLKFKETEFNVQENYIQMYLNDQNSYEFYDNGIIVVNTIYGSKEIDLKALTSNAGAGSTTNVNNNEYGLFLEGEGVSDNGITTIVCKNIINTKGFRYTLDFGVTTNGSYKVHSIVIPSANFAMNYEGVIIKGNGEDIITLSGELNNVKLFKQKIC